MCRSSLSEVGEGPQCSTEGTLERLLQHLNGACVICTCPLFASAHINAAPHRFGPVDVVEMASKVARHMALMKLVNGRCPASAYADSP